MKYIRTLSVLSVTFSIVWCMAIESAAPRYLEEPPLLSSNPMTTGIFKLKLNHSTSNIFNIDNGISSRDDIVDDILEPEPNTETVIINDFLDFEENSQLLFDNNEPSQGRKIRITNTRNTKRKGNNKRIYHTIKGVRKNSTAPVRTKPQGQKTRRKTTKPLHKIRTSNKNTTTRKPNIKISTPKPLKTMKLSTLAPIKIILTKATTSKPRVSTPKSYDGLATTTIKTTRTKGSKPTIKTVLTKWTDNLNDTSSLKQNWYEEGIPYPNPMPEINSNSPPFSIADANTQIVSSTVENSYVDDIVQDNLANEDINPEISTNSPSTVLQGVPSILPNTADDLTDTLSIAENSNSDRDSLNKPISTFNIDLVPSGLDRDSIGSGCPTVHISSSVLAPQQRQECSDLNLVLNTHYHQNQNSQNTRIPSISTYDADAGPVVEAADTSLSDEVIPEDEFLGADEIGNAGEIEPVVADDLANSGIADPLGAGDLANSGIAADPGSAGGVPSGAPAGSSGGSGGSGGSGSNGGLGQWKFPDLKHMFEAVGYLSQGAGWLLMKLMNPWLYIVPVVLFFVIGFKSILLLFPWWIPLVFLYFSAKSEEPKPSITHVNHHHKPVVLKHHDGWFWDQHTKSWKNVVDRKRKRRSLRFEVDDKIRNLGKMIITNDELSLEQKYMYR